MPKQFIWLIQSALPRKDMPMLKQGETHNVADYSAEVVNEWVKTGAAKLVETKSKKKEGE